MGWTGNNLCVLCGSFAETADHLFTRFMFSCFVIGMGDGAGGFYELGGNVRGAWEERSGGRLFGGGG